MKWVHFSLSLIPTGPGHYWPQGQETGQALWCHGRSEAETAGVAIGRADWALQCGLLSARVSLVPLLGESGGVLRQEEEGNPVRREGGLCVPAQALGRWQSYEAWNWCGRRHKRCCLSVGICDIAGKPQGTLLGRQWPVCSPCLPPLSALPEAPLAQPLPLFSQFVNNPFTTKLWYCFNPKSTASRGWRQTFPSPHSDCDCSKCLAWPTGPAPCSSHHLLCLHGGAVPGAHRWRVLPKERGSETRARGRAAEVCQCSTQLSPVHCAEASSRRDQVGRWMLIHVLRYVVVRSGTCPGQCWDMSWSVLGHVLDSAGTCPGQCWDMSWTVLGHVLDSAGACPGQCWDMSWTVLGHVLDSAGTCPGQCWGMSWTVLGLLGHVNC